MPYVDNNNTQKQASDIFFLLIKQQTIGVSFPYNLLSSDLRMIFKNKNTVWSAQERMWVLKVQNYENTFKAVQQHYHGTDTRVHAVSSFAWESLKPIEKQLEVRNCKYAVTRVIAYGELEKDIDVSALPFYDKLYGFQKEAVRFGIQHHGRMLLADEMGVGKTIQSLALAYLYRHEWPLMIICPSALRLNWQQEVMKWLQPRKQQVQILAKAGVGVREGVRILIVSYDIAWKVREMLDQFRVAIADEAHYLKNSGNKRSDALVPLLSTRRRVILLTGTPAFAKPREIYNLLSITRPDLFFKFKQFAYRYCEPKYNPWSRALQFNGCKNAKQLHFLIKDRLMLRRLKKEVLSELPDKQRQRITVETDKTITKDIKKLLGQYEKGQGSLQKKILQMLGEGAGDNRQAVNEAYGLTGKAKAAAASQYVLSLLENDTKLLVFAHHQSMLDSLEAAIAKESYKIVRIDGQVTQEMRHQRVSAFQEDPTIMVALLSITAAGVGLTLTAASTVVFAELHWTPAMLLQAEDRAHRIGQKTSVNCHYLIGENTIDNILYAHLEKKIKHVSSFVDGVENKLEIEQMIKGEKGKISKRSLLEKKEEDKGEIKKLLNYTTIRPFLNTSLGTQETEIQSDISVSNKRVPIKIVQQNDQSSEKKQKQTALIEKLKTLLSPPKKEGQNKQIQRSEKIVIGKKYIKNLIEQASPAKSNETDSI